MPRKNKQGRKRLNLLRDWRRLSTPFRNYLAERSVFGSRAVSRCGALRSIAMLAAPFEPDEELPIFSRDGRHKGDKGLDGRYHCYEKTGGKYVSHYRTSSYLRLCDHIDILHNV